MVICWVVAMRSVFVPSAFTFRAQDGGTMFPRNVGINPKCYMAQQPRLPSLKNVIFTVCYLYLKILIQFVVSVQNTCWQFKSKTSCSCMFHDSLLIRVFKDIVPTTALYRVEWGMVRLCWMMNWRDVTGSNRGLH